MNFCLDINKQRSLQFACFLYKNESQPYNKNEKEREEAECEEGDCEEQHEQDWKEAEEKKKEQEKMKTNKTEKKTERRIRRK